MQGMWIPIPGQGTKIPHAANYRAHVPWSSRACHNKRQKNPHATTREKPAHCKERSHMPQ